MALTKKGILCTFSISQGILQKWVNLRFTHGNIIQISNNIIICCGEPFKVRVFNTDTLKHLGTLPNLDFMEHNNNNNNIVNNSIITIHNGNDNNIPSLLSNFNQNEVKKNIVKAMISSDQSRLIIVYGNGIICVWSLVHNIDNKNSNALYKFKLFTKIETTSSKNIQSIIQISHNNIIGLDRNGYLHWFNLDMISSMKSFQDKNDQLKLICRDVYDNKFIIGINKYNELIFIDAITISVLFRLSLSFLKDNIKNIKLYDNKILVYTNQTGKAVIYEFNEHNNNELKESNVLEFNQSIQDTCFDPNDNNLIVLTDSQLLKYSLNDISGNNNNIDIKVLANNNGTMKHIQMHPENHFMIMYGNDNRIVLFDTETYHKKRTYEITNSISNVIFDDSGLYMCVSCINKVYIIDWFSGSIICKGKNSVTKITDLLFCSENNSIISLNMNSIIMVYQLPSNMSTAIKQRTIELNSKTNTARSSNANIDVSFEELKNLQLMLPGGLSIDDLIDKTPKKDNNQLNTSSKFCEQTDPTTTDPTTTDPTTTDDHDVINPPKEDIPEIIPENIPENIIEESEDNDAGIIITTQQQTNVKATEIDSNDIKVDNDPNILKIDIPKDNTDEIDTNDNNDGGTTVEDNEDNTISNNDHADAVCGVKNTINPKDIKEIKPTPNDINAPIENDSEFVDGIIQESSKEETEHSDHIELKENPDSTTDDKDIESTDTKTTDIIDNEPQAKTLLTTISELNDDGKGIIEEISTKNNNDTNETENDEFIVNCLNESMITLISQFKQIKSIHEWIKMKNMDIDPIRCKLNMDNIKEMKQHITDLLSLNLFDNFVNFDNEYNHKPI